MRLFILLGMFVAAPVCAATLCAKQSGPLYSVAPVPGEKLPKEASRLHEGASYKVVREGAGWVLLDLHTSQLWAERKYFDSVSCVNRPGAPASGGAKPTAAASGAAVAGAAATQPPRTSGSVKPAPKPSDSLGCLCSSGQVCTGPRGGRYCITSGGNKRYGV